MSVFHSVQVSASLFIVSSSGQLRFYHDASALWPWNRAMLIHPLAVLGREAAVLEDIGGKRPRCERKCPSVLSYRTEMGISESSALLQNRPGHIERSVLQPL